MLKSILKQKPGEHVSLHTTASGQFVINRFIGPGPSQAPTLEEAISDYHSRLMGFAPVTVLHKKVQAPRSGKGKSK